MGVTEELRALAVVVDRLAEKFPEVPREHIEDLVQQEHRSLDRGRVRDFVPLLVEHSARDRLTHFTPHDVVPVEVTDGKLLIS
jgi:hypothetical protein